MKRYPKYKETGVPWLGQVPAHWEVKRLKRVFSETREKAIQGDEQLAATQKYGVVSQAQFMKDQDQKLVLAMKGTENFKHVERDDFVISLRAFEGGIERSSQSGCVSPAYTVLRSKGAASPAFAARLLKTPEFISQISMTYDGIREGKAIKFKDAGPVSLPIPPLTEQAGIAIFLDGVLDQMDSAIAAQERMIELLKERRSAIITQAVTKGLDSKAKMKDSGVPWLGQVPAHWPIARYKHVFREKHSKKDSALQAGAISYGRVVFKDAEMLPAATKTSYQEVLNGEFLINPINLNYDLKSLRTALSEIDVCVSPAYIVLRPIIDAAPGYLKYQLHVFDVCHMKTLGAGVRQTISFGDIGGCETVVPPKPDQVAIAMFLDRVVGEMDSSISSQERMIELLKERRSAIITQAVTGQIDVR